METGLEAVPSGPCSGQTKRDFKKRGLHVILRMSSLIYMQSFRKSYLAKKKYASDGLTD